jgi:hypothetical protein
VFAGYFDDFSLIFLHSLALFFSPPLQAKPSVACSGVIVVYYDCYCYYKYRASTWLSSIARLPSHWAASIVSTAADFFFQALRQPILQRISFDRKNTSIFISIYLSICLYIYAHAYTSAAVLSNTLLLQEALSIVFCTHFYALLTSLASKTWHPHQLAVPPHSLLKKRKNNRNGTKTKGRRTQPTLARCVSCLFY